MSCRAVCLSPGMWSQDSGLGLGTTVLVSRPRSCSWDHRLGDQRLGLGTGLETENYDLVLGLGLLLMVLAVCS